VRVVFKRGRGDETIIVGGVLIDDVARARRVATRARAHGRRGVTSGVS